MLYDPDNNGLDDWFAFAFLAALALATSAGPVISAPLESGFVK